MGEPAGIGGETVLKAWMARDHHALPCFALIDNVERLKRLAAQIGLKLDIAEIKSFAEVPAAFAEALPVLNIDLDHLAQPGRPSADNASAVLDAIGIALDGIKNNHVSGLITNPVQKSVLYSAGFRHSGQTEYLAELACSKGFSEETLEPVMMLACDELRVVPLTIHTALRDVPEQITQDLVIRKAGILSRALQRDMGIENPRLAMAALNPHAGEDGAMGSEEREILQPAAKALRQAGINITDPQSADTLFHVAKRMEYDAVVCMYHDQALIPIKTIDFERGVNITLGLPFIRTSPDHGTALDIAGSGQANPASLIAALYAAESIAGHRARFDAAMM